MGSIEIFKLQQDLEKIIQDTKGSCLCGHFEWCEECSPDSRVNRLRDAIRRYIKELGGINEHT